MTVEVGERALPAEVPLPLLGRSTSRVGLGTGGLLRIPRSRQRQALLAGALEAGITHFDTAPIYGFGESERALGRFLRGRRSQVTLTTKFGLQPSWLAARLRPLQSTARQLVAAFPAVKRAAVAKASALYAAPSFPLAGIRASLEASLRALQTDHVDFFLAHQASTQALPGEEVIGLLESLRAAGKIRAFGVATQLDWLMPVINARPGLGAVLQFDCQLQARPVLPVSAYSGGSLIITYGYLGRSIAACRERLHGEPGGEADTQRLRGIERLDDEELAGLLLRGTVLANPNGIVLMQSRSIARIARNVQAANNPLEDERVHALAALLEPQR